MIDDLFQKLDGALERAAPGLHANLRGAATLREVEGAERALGVPLPAELRELYAWHDGQTGSGTFPAHGKSVAEGFFVPLARSLEVRARHVDHGWPSGWLPLIDAGNGDYLCFDLDGGGVVEFQHETPRRPLVAPSLAAWIEAILAGLDEPPAAATAPPVSAYLRDHAEPVRSWQDLRSWVRGMKECGSHAVFARIALALDERPAHLHHPAMTSLVESVEGWLAEPSDQTLQRVRDAVSARSRSFVPAAQVSFAAQHAAEAVVVDSLDRACDGALHALARAAPGIVEGQGADAETKCVELQERVREALSET